MFCAYTKEAQISGERLQHRWSSGSKLSNSQWETLIGTLGSYIHVTSKHLSVVENTVCSRLNFSFVDSVSHIIASATADMTNPPTSSAITSETATEQSKVVANQSPNPSLVNFKLEDQSSGGLKFENQSTLDEDQSAEAGAEPEFIVHTIDEGTSQLIINFDLVRITYLRGF